MAASEVGKEEGFADGNGSGEVRMATTVGGADSNGDVTEERRSPARREGRRAQRGKGEREISIGEWREETGERREERGEGRARRGEKEGGRNLISYERTSN